MFKQITLIALILVVTVAFAKRIENSSSEEEDIKAVIISETTNWFNRNYEGWADAWAHEKYNLAMYPGPGSYSEYTSWDSLNSDSKIEFEKNNMPRNVDIERSNWNIRIYNNGAWATYIQHMINPDDRKKLAESREVRFLEKKNGSWKIVYLSAVYKSAYEQESVENTMNNTGYKLLNQGNLKEAIDVFKLNVILYPKSANAYDSLAEAYMKNGDKALAKENYQKSFELDPNNDNAIQMLKKLKE